MVRKDNNMTTTKLQKTKKRRPRGTGTIYYDKKRKRYMGQVIIDIGNDKTKKKTVSGRTKTEVSDRMKEVEYKSIKGEYIEKDKSTIYEFADNLIEEQLSLNEIRQSTYDRKKATLKMLDDISGKQIQEVTEDDIKKFFFFFFYYSQSCINKMYQLLGWVFQKINPQKVDYRKPFG